MTTKSQRFDVQSQHRNKMHRIATVRRQQDISLRTAAKRLGKTEGQAKQMEDESLDLPLSTIYEWQEILDVPITELLVEADDRLSPAILHRARLIRAMKSVMSLVDSADNPAVKRFAHNLQEDLTAIMPELRDVSPWPSIGQCHAPHESARAIRNPFPDEIFKD